MNISAYIKFVENDLQPCFVFFLRINSYLIYIFF